MVSTAAAAVIDGHGLAECVGQLLRHHAGHRIDAAAGWIGHDERDTARWKISRDGSRTCDLQGNNRCKGDHGVYNAAPM